MCVAAEAYWALAQSEPTVQGFNAWHWSDRPGMDPTSGFARGVVSLGPELRQCKSRDHTTDLCACCCGIVEEVYCAGMEWVGKNITQAHPFKPWVPPPPPPANSFRCISNTCVAAANGVPKADCDKDCGPTHAAVASAAAPAPPNSAQELQRSVNAAIASGAPSLTLPGGHYEFGAVNFNIHGAKSLDLLAPEPVSLLFSVKNAGVNISNCEDLSIGNITIDYDVAFDDDDDSDSHDDSRDGAGKPPGAHHGAITLNLLNCTRVSVSDVTIKKAGFMVLTAFNGGGAHTFRRVVFKPTIGRHCRDAVHFSDQRLGSTIEDSIIGYTSDDLFNIHT